MGSGQVRRTHGRAPHEGAGQKKSPAVAGPFFDSRNLMFGLTRTAFCNTAGSRRRLLLCSSSSLKLIKSSNVLLADRRDTNLIRCYKTTSLASHLDDLLSSHDQPLLSHGTTT
jgi:hypothetical protein